jgi:general secretion pathway protein J
MSARATAGFTLLEILVVIAVLGFLLVGLSQTVRFGLTAWRQEMRLSESKADLEAVDRTLRAVVENFAPGDDSGRSPIDGSANALTGVSRLRVPGSGTASVPIEAGLAVSGSRLVLRWRRYHHGLPLGPVAPATETELMNGVSRLQIEYWQSPGIWVSRWRETDLPLLVRFRLTFAGAATSRWPDIVVAPRLSRP